MFPDFLSLLAFECRPKFLWEEFLVCRKLALCRYTSCDRHTEWPTRKLRNIILLWSISHRIGFHPKEWIHICLTIAAILTIDLILAECLGWRIWVSFCGLGIERTTVNFLLQSLVVLYLAGFFVGEGSWSFEVWMRL
jgi:hypothetical protein